MEVSGVFNWIEEGKEEGIAVEPWLKAVEEVSPEENPEEEEVEAEPEPEAEAEEV